MPTDRVLLHLAPDLRRLAELANLLAPQGNVRIHRDHAVNLANVRQIRDRTTPEVGS